MPEDPKDPLRGYVLDGQARRTGVLFTKMAFFTPDGFLRLPSFSETDSDMGIRAYDFEEILS